jgi:hypothetical protein
MTVNTENIYSGPYTGNDISDTFSYGFRIQDESQLNVYKTDDEGNRELLTLTTDYTVTGVDNDLGGTITLVAGALPLDYEIFIEANYPATQDTAFASQGRFNPKIHEDALDKLTFLIKQLQYALTNTVQFAPGYTGASPVLPDPEAGDLIRWTEDGIEGLTIGELLSEASAIISQLNMNGNQIKDLAAATEAGDAINLTQATQLLAQSGVDGVVPNVFPTQTGDGVTVTFSTPASGTTGAVASSFFVHIDNAYQTPDVHFTVDAGTGDLTFVAAPPEDSSIYITYFNPVAIENPDDALVTATGTTTPRSLADWMRDAIKCPDGINTEIVAGILRKDSIGTATWSFLNNVDHATVGINNPNLPVTAVGESLTIDFGKTYKKVVSFICGPDETLASKLNATVGASVGLSSAEIRLGISAECSGVVRWNGSGGIQDVELGPFFVNPVTTMSNGLAKTTIDALSSPYVSKDDSISISPYSGSANIVPFMPCLKSYGYDSHDVNFINNYGSSFYGGGPSLNIGYLWNRSVCRPAILDGREAAAFENILAAPFSNIWFFGVFEV